MGDLIVLRAVGKTEQTGQITGKLSSTSNPICFGQRCVITWNTNDPWVRRYAFQLGPRACAFQSHRPSIAKREPDVNLETAYGIVSRVEIV